MTDAKKNEEDRQGKSAAAIAALDASEQSKSEPKTTTPKAKPKEKSGVGSDNTVANLQARINAMRARLKAAQGAGNTKMASDITAKIKAAQEEIASHKSK